MTRTDLGLTIGEFGRRAGLSIKALRLYDVSGLLTPVSVDPSGYRRYAESQLGRARTISLLRQLDMPLSVVAEVLAASPGAAVDRLDRWWAGQEQLVEVRRHSVGWLRTRLLASEPAEPGYEVHRRWVPATKVASIRFETDQQGLLDTIQRGHWEVRNVLEAAGAVTTAEHWVLYHGFVTPESVAPIEVCVPFTGPVEPAWDVVIRVEPAHDEAYATVSRDDCFYPRIMTAYAAVESFLSAAALPMSGPPREVYLDSWVNLTGADPFVHVATPFTAPEA
ncbi:MerR family transcriptional regulator [Actinoplanes sp. N902-109]|uniref:MerR family transcriptional regulator n=1 Tax=Actinoplanes sp. (strain N902-109) TaxID=649831 RepID=UPI0003295196|nr:MerR family transcriptional regulator [Actinoplanes sp. N902-109]AGL20161.1 MerR family transcriptional regulator [Actinoplanes sp. N902-109]